MFMKPPMEEFMTKSEHPVMEMSVVSSALNLVHQPSVASSLSADWLLTQTVSDHFVVSGYHLNCELTSSMCKAKELDLNPKLSVFVALRHESCYDLTLGSSRVKQSQQR
jgi:hypothetical protein